MTIFGKNSLITKRSPKGDVLEIVENSPERNKILCNGCAKCCLHVNHEIDSPENDEDCDYIIWFLLHENISIWVDDENVWYIEFKTSCKALKHELCDIYEKRPRVCREYSQDKCLNANLDDDISFGSPEEFLDYMKRVRKYSYHGFYTNNHLKSTFRIRSMVFLIWLGAALFTAACVWGGILLIHFSIAMFLILVVLSSIVLLFTHREK